MVAKRTPHGPATYADIEALPANMVGELIRGVLYAHPRPASPHAAASSALGEELGPPFKRGRGGPGGWVILDEPELHLREDVLVPDLGGWRRERMPEMPNTAAFTLAPDWACEVLSPSTGAIDRAEKVPIYAREHVSHVWLVDPIERYLEILRLDGATYRLVATFYGDAKVRAEPFDAIELDLSALWAR
ncbi:MAG: Uma2 family endonuclease [Myxococcales bacterium]|nr:Uma2 family endonuclease [Myxococcales bacterium]